MASVDADPEALPAVLSREAYRIVQEGLSNALKHAGDQVTMVLRIGVAGGLLEITLENPLGSASPCRPGGGHGLRGIADRARLLGGTVEAGAESGTWRLRVRLPVKGPV